jgi:hypothetical protein
LRRNFWFCAIEDPAGFITRDRIGVDKIMVESDYPHADGTWPDTQDSVDQQLQEGGLSPEEQEKVTYLNAARLFRHPLPSEVGLGEQWPQPCFDDAR